MAIAPRSISKTQALDLYASLPARFRASVVGQIYQRVLEQLQENGQAQADQVLANLFPDEAPLAARRELSTRYINRPYKDDNGSSPLRMCMTRPSRKQPITSLIWFETDTAAPPPLQDLNSPRNVAAHFTDTLAESVGSEEISQATAQAAEPPIPQRIKDAEADMAMSTREQHRPLHGLPPQGLRARVDDEYFQDTSAQRSTGMDEPGGDGDEFPAFNAADRGKHPTLQA
ncbi:MAG: hypothetical protein KAY39_01605, partial [Burkholderiaceae bacterium]|nr:hypothetical protein [Burkholderiaceae bacterium]